MKTLVIFQKQLGDFVLLQPALRRLAAWAGEPAEVSTNPGFAPLFDLCEGYLRKAAERAAYDHLYVLERGSAAAFAAAFRKARRKHLLVPKEEEIRWFHRLIFQEIRAESPNQEYRAKYYWNYFAGETPFAPPSLKIPPPEWSPPGFEHERYLLVHPTSAWRNKCWSAESWGIVIEQARLSGLSPVVLTGGLSDWERKHCAEISAQVPQLSANLAGRTSLRELCWLVAHARIVLTVDGAVSHLASAFQKPCLTLFGPTNPLHWHNPAEHAARVSATEYSKERKPSLSHIPADRVLFELFTLAGKL